MRYVILFAIVSLTLLPAHAMAAPAAVPAMGPDPCQDLSDRWGAKELHHEVTPILRGVLERVKAGDGTVKVWAARGHIIIVAARVAECGGRWLYAAFKTGYDDVPAIIRYKGERYGLVTHFLPEGGYDHVRGWVRAFQARALTGIRRLLVDFGNNAADILNLVPVPGGYRCTPAQFEQWGWRWCAEVNQ